MLDEMVAVELAMTETDGDATPPADLADRIFDRAFGTRTASSDALAPDAAPLRGTSRPV